LEDLIMNIRPSILQAFLVLPLVTSSFASTAATNAAAMPIPAGVTRVLSGPQPTGFGGGPATGPKDFITDAQREELRKAVDANVERLRLSGKLLATAVDAHPLFGWPLRMAAGLPDPGYHGISNFVDLNPSFPGFLLDFNCGTRSYDTADGYNHRGTDFYTWPWSWRKMDRNEVEVVAAAPGQIIYRGDGNFDRSCGFNNNNWNAIFVQHSDGSMAWYGHMKSGSLTTKQVGDTVLEGEFLGVVGSSGNSTGPHLHLETYDALGQLIEPWAGTCNALNAETWWKTQRAYYDSAVNRVTTGDLPADFPTCPLAENPNARATFPAGAQVYFTTYYHDQLGSQLSTYTIYRPDGSIYAQWTHSSPAPHYSSSWWWWSFGFPVGEIQGAWRFTVDYEGTTTERVFMLGTPAACGNVPEMPAQGEVLQIGKNSTLLRLTWGASCNPPDTDYVLYDGAIGSYYSHSRIACSTGGNRVANISPATDSRYYLVGARNTTTPTREGSLGHSSAGTERPVGTIACFTRLSIPCP
jgi:murein DD-endopeptidase MepM/ murein hydrolase activator NlpD